LNAGSASTARITGRLLTTEGTAAFTKPIETCRLLSAVGGRASGHADLESPRLMPLPGTGPTPR